MTLGILLVACLLLAFANGANDNFKGVATLFGSGTTNYRTALLWATVTTLLGSLTALFLAGTLLKSFSGKGLVSDALVANADYCAAVALAAGLTVLLAARIGMPISTTHALVGALVGAGYAAGSTVDFAQLGGSFFLPLLVSPVIALAVTGLLYPLLRKARRAVGVTEETCLCLNREVLEVMPAGQSMALSQRMEALSVQVGDSVTCHNRYQGQVCGVEAGDVLNAMHYLSAGVLSFARGLNDTPKIAAMLLLLPWFGGSTGLALVGIAMAIGGLLNSRQVAETMSQKITKLNHGQGFTCNVISGTIVIGASLLGSPVSTTHVSCGALFGIGAVTDQARWSMIRTIILAWIATLPVGAVLGLLVFKAMRLV
jgi:PiT family inorganic phosphate transporter